MRINSIFSFFPFIKMQNIYEIINCFINLDFNAQEATTYIIDQKNVNIAKSTVLKIYKRLRDILYKYLFLVYGTETLGELNKGDYFSIDQSLIYT